VLWAGLQGDLASLQALQAAVEKTVSPLGFPSEERRFSPHLTVGRLRDDASPEARAYLGSAIQALHLAPAAFTVRGISLMRSDLQPQGAVYTRLYEARLGQLVAP
jgi:2'-5' RNA ligase